jgi:3-hydroxybutyryl-CoA dehydrogenase
VSVFTLVSRSSTIEFGKKIGKTIFIVKDTPGFIVNGLMMPYSVNAILMLENDVASKEDIDVSINLGLDYPMGSLTLADLIGLDTVLFVMEAMYQDYRDLGYAPPPLLKKMVAAGWLGRKTGKGFYDYRMA